LSATLQVHLCAAPRAAENVEYPQACATDSFRALAVAFAPGALVAGLTLVSHGLNLTPLTRHHRIRILKCARSITARLFTRNESAQNHWQVGNYGLAPRTIVNWLDEMLVEKAEKVEKLRVTGTKVADVAQIKSSPLDIGIRSAPLQSGPPAGARAFSGISP
jgi:hypothetical protein